MRASNMGSEQQQKTSDGLATGVVRQVAVVSVLTVLLLAPFVAKAVHIDDPTFLWTGQQILKAPLDFYGFAANWYGYEFPMSQMMQNPPLTGFFMALAARLVGWSETGLHIAFLTWGVGLALGTLVLARRWTDKPLAAALAALCTPVFLVSATTLMCDVMMTCLWVWAIVTWECGLDRHGWRRAGWLVFSGLLIAAVALTKYFGIAVIPLLVVHTLMREPRAARWLFVFVVPAAILALYEWWTARIYGQGMLRTAFTYAGYHQTLDRSDLWVKSLLVGLTFTGGCHAVVLFLAPRLWGWKTITCGLLAAALATVALVFSGAWPYPLLEESMTIKWLLAAQACLWGVIGADVLALAAAEWWRRPRQAVSVTLFLWVMGTFTFAWLLNWSITARTLLPMTPAVAILAMRRISFRERGRDQKREQDSLQRAMPWKDLAALSPAAVLAVAVARADYIQAGTARQAAQDLLPTVKASQGTVWFLGHWGFQYYLEQAGARAMHIEGDSVVRGDIIVLPLNNCNADLPDELDLFPKFRMAYLPVRWLTTTQGEVGAGFYSSDVGMLPFAFVPVPPERYFIMGVQGNPMMDR